MSPVFFASSTEWRKWLEAHHAKETEILVGMYKGNFPKPYMTWPESVDEALCFGWIDGVKRSIDAISYTTRFTPRKSGSIWSNVNIAKAESLIAQGRMTPPGLAKFQARSSAKSGIYSFEQDAVEFDGASLAEFRKNPAAWQFFQTTPPSYRKKMTWLVISARQPATRQKRLAMLIEASKNHRRI